VTWKENDGEVREQGNRGARCRGGRWRPGAGRGRAGGTGAAAAADGRPAAGALAERSRDEAGGLRLTGEGSMPGELVRAVLERALEAELTGHLGYERNDRAGRGGGGGGNYRNGTIGKTVQTGVGPVPLAVPRDRNGTFEPVLVPKRSGRVAGGPGRHDHLAVRARHERAGHPAPPGAGLRHPAVARDRLADHRRRAGGGPRLAVPAAGPGLRGGVPGRDLGGVRDSQVVQDKPAYLAIGIDADGEKHVLGIWLAKTPPETATAGEGARFWGSVMADLKNRGVRDILIACCDGLAGSGDAITGAFPGTVVQRCVVHLIRNALRPVARRDAGAVAKELRAACTAPTAEAAFDALAAFAASPWGRKYPQAVRVWEDAWDAFTPFLAFSPAVRKLLYTTNAIESLNYQLRKVTKARGHFPNDDAVVKLLWLAIINIEDKRARERLARRQQAGKRADQPARLVEGQRVMGWREALNELDTAYPGRLR
jgi:putative transposase